MAPKRAAPASKASPAKKAKAASKATKAKAPTKKAEPKEAAPSSGVKPAATGDVHLVVEHCKQCQCFKRRTAELESLLHESLEKFQWTVNPEKPRKGCFEVRDAEGDRTYITLLDMPRPFKKLKELDMDEVASKIVEEIKA